MRAYALHWACTFMSSAAIPSRWSISDVAMYSISLAYGSSSFTLSHRFQSYMSSLAYVSRFLFSHHSASVRVFCFLDKPNMIVF